MGAVVKETDAFLLNLLGYLMLSNITSVLQRQLVSPLYLLSQRQESRHKPFRQRAGFDCEAAVVYFSDEDVAHNITTPSPVLPSTVFYVPPNIGIQKMNAGTDY